MSNSFFRFKRFCIHHDRCAMKVGTDGVLLGAWGSVKGKRILDIGTGTGLIALMAAQRNSQAIILGIDIDEEAVLQAQENIAESPFADRVSCSLQDVAFFSPEVYYDAILCNPPFFTEDTLPNDTRRTSARNSKSLSFSLLVKKVASLLNVNGQFSVIIPYRHMQEFVSLCLSECLYLNRRCIVRTIASKPPTRVLMTFYPNLTFLHSGLSSDSLQYNLQYQELCLITDDGNKSREYIELTKDFYY